MMVNESGAGAGVGFPAPGELVADAADATDTLLGALLLYVGEVGTGADEVATTLSVSTNVFELGTGAGAILTSSSTELIDDSADARTSCSVRCSNQSLSLSTASVRRMYSMQSRPP